MITIVKKSQISGKEHSMKIPLTETEYQEGRWRHINGSLIQDAFPTLNADQREFILTGITPEEWRKLFG